MSTYISGYFANTINKDSAPVDTATLDGSAADPAATLEGARFYLADTSGGVDVTCTLPSSEALAGQVITFYANGANAVVATPAAGDAILPAAANVTVAANTPSSIISDGNGNWILLF